MSKSQDMNDKRRFQIFFNDDECMTQQHFRDECDVNTIMLKYGASRLLEHYGQFQGNYGDFTEVQDYQTSLNEVIKAEEMFMSLPSQLRSRFENDPSQFLSFVSDEANRSEMQSLGLLKPDVQAPNYVPLDSAVSA
nr:MAG: internal scaffolding protein [Microvirus sp.]